MNRTEKQRILHNTLQGQLSKLQELHIQKCKDAMPFRHVHGVIDIYQCPTEFLDIQAIGGVENIINQKIVQEPLRNWINRFKKHSSNHKNDGVFGIIDLKDDNFSKIELNYIYVQCQDYRAFYQKGGNINRLRQYHDKCIESISGSSIAIYFETSPHEMLPNLQVPGNVLI